MALDDFDEADQELELDLEQLDLTARGKIDPSDPLDEDLFDFPDMGIFESLEEAAEASSSASVTEASSPVHADEPEVETDTWVAGTPGSPGYDPELDEDIFDFGGMPGMAVSSAGESPSETAAPQGEDTFIVPEELTTAPSSTPTEAKSEAQEIPRPTPGADTTAAPPAAHDLDVELAALAGSMPVPVTVPIAAEGGRDKVILALAAAFLLVNTALIFLAWQANSSFHGTLTEVTRSLAEGIAKASPPVQAAPSVEFVPVPTTGHEPHTPDLDPSDLDSLPDQALTAARRMMSEGAYIDARKQLNHLLANADLYPLDRELIAEAEFLIAETYELQGSALLEEAGR